MTFLGRVCVGTAIMVALGGCRSEDHRAAHSFGTLVDCSQVGRVTSVSDPVGGIRPNIPATAKGPVVPPALPGIDLRRVSVARGGGRLCVEFRTAEAADHPLALELIARQKEQGDSAGEVVVDVLVFTDRAPYVRLLYPDTDVSPGRGLVPAQIGVRGNRVSVVLARRVWPDSLITVFDNLQWHAASMYLGPVPHFRGIQFTDCVPDGQFRITYPEGHRFHSVDAHCP